MDRSEKFLLLIWGRESLAVFYDVSADEGERFVMQDSDLGKNTTLTY